MRVILSAYPDRVETNRHLWGEFDVFDPGLVGPKEAHRLLAVHAVAERWDETVRVQQDDVVVDSWPRHHSDVTAYSPDREGHCCPKAFTATLRGWEQLERAWRRHGRTCELWHPDHHYDTTRSI